MHLIPEWFFPQWIDSIWLLIALIAAGKKQRLLSLIFIGACMAMMRMQIEMLVAMGYSFGMLKLLPYHIFWRGVASYSLVYVLYFIFIRVFPGSRGVLLLASMISLFFLAFLLSTFIMVL